MKVHRGGNETIMILSMWFSACSKASVDTTMQLLTEKVPSFSAGAVAGAYSQGAAGATGILLCE